MLTYRLQPRVLKLQQGEDLPFPAIEATIEIKLGSASAAGMWEGYGRTVVHERKAEMLYDSNTGRMLFKCDPPLETLDVTKASPEVTFTMKGDVLRYLGPCGSNEALSGLI